jgi:hypothetical protein
MKEFAAKHGFTFSYVLDETQDVARSITAQMRSPSSSASTPKMNSNIAASTSRVKTPAARPLAGSFFRAHFRHRVKLNSVEGAGVTEPGLQRMTNRLPYPYISNEFPGKIDTSTPYVIGKIVSRLEMDSRWPLARSVRALVSERDALKEEIETR